VLKLKWNLSGRTAGGQSKEPPPEHLDFVRRKRLEFIAVMGSSALAAAAAVACLAARQGEDALAVVATSALWVVAGTLGLSLFT